jgi:large subunit ribosomal protein L7/L12
MADKKENKNLDKLIEEISALTVVELSELVTALKEKFGVEAMPTAVAAAPAEPAAAADAPTSSTQTVMLTGAGGNKIAVIKALREINPNLGLKEAKDMTEATPAEVMKDAKAEDAKAAADKLKAAGAEVELK